MAVRPFVMVSHKKEKEFALIMERLRESFEKALREMPEMTRKEFLARMAERFEE